MSTNEPGWNCEHEIDSPDPHRQQRVRLWFPTGINGQWEHNRISVPEIIRNTPLTLKEKAEYMQILIFRDVFGIKPLFRVVVANQKALQESRHALMIRNQERILEQNKKNIVIIKKQLRLLETLAEEILCTDTLEYLYSVIEKYKPYIEGTEWNTTTTTTKTTTAQTEKFREWMQAKSFKKNN